MLVRTNFIVALALSLATASVTQAEDIVLSAGGASTDTNRGAFNSEALKAVTTTSWKVVSNNWQVRVLPNGTEAVEATRSYTLFTVPALTADQTIESARLSIPHPTNSYTSPNATETVNLWSIDNTSTADLRSNELAVVGVGNRPDIFVDLGAGISYGSLVASPASNGTTQAVTLNAQALASLNAVAHQAAGGDWGYGAALANVASPATTQQRVFGGTGGSFITPTTLTLTVTTSAPTVPAAPTTYCALLGLMVVALAFSRRARHSSAANEI